MADYIEREAAVRAILSKEWRNIPEGHFPDEEYAYNDGLLMATHTIEAIPAADVVEVVRCGECMHRDEITGWCDDVQDYISNTNWFCAGGVRKGDADDDQR